MRYRKFFRIRPDSERELRRQLDEEIETHLALRTEELVTRGMDPGSARAEAERRFGDRHLARQELYASARRREKRHRRERWTWELGRDARLALRRLVRSPAYAGTSVGIFALAIALTTSIFALVDHVLLRSLPFPDAHLLYALQSVGESGTPFSKVSMGNWYDWRNEIGGFPSR